jgi:hypothetical protein
MYAIEKSLAGSRFQMDIRGKTAPPACLFHKVGCFRFNSEREVDDDIEVTIVFNPACSDRSEYVEPPPASSCELSGLSRDVERSGTATRGLSCFPLRDRYDFRHGVLNEIKTPLFGRARLWLTTIAV